MLFLTTNDQIREELSSLSAELKVISIRVSEELSTNLKYSRAGYIRLMILRTKIINFLLKNGIETFLFECDFLWIKSPLDLFMSERGKHDMILIPDTKNNNVINGGFFYLFPTQRTKSFFVKLTEMMIDLGKEIIHLSSDKGVPESQNDQVFLTSLVKKGYAGINVLLMSFEQFPSGLWYKFPFSTTKLWKPYVIHNNYIIGNANKEKRAKERRFWFLTDDSKCNESRVDDFFLNQ